MKLFTRKDGSLAVAEPPAANGQSAGDASVREEFTGSDAELAGEIERVGTMARSRPDRAAERRLLWLSHLAGLRKVEAEGGEPEHPDADEPALAPFAGALPAVAPSAVTPGLLRAAILRDGCLYVKGLVSRGQARGLARDIDESFKARERVEAGQTPQEGYYEEFVVHERADPFLGRKWIKMGGGVLAADAPRVHFAMTEAFRQAGIPELVSAYLGEPAVMAVNKTTLRKAEPEVPGAWHQDGKFMGPVRALNLWLALSDCGEKAPGLDLVPRRLDEYVQTKTEEATLDVLVSQKKAEEAAGERRVVRPRFEAGDALLFDELFLHKTGSEPSMRKPRFAIECWFFGASAFPAAYAPIAV